MKLKSLRVEEIPSWQDNAGQYTGTIAFYDGKGDVQLKLSVEQCNKIFLICADAIINVAKEAAQNLTYVAMEQQKQLTSTQGT